MYIVNRKTHLLKKGLMSMNLKKALFALLTLVLCTSATAEEQWTWTLRRSGPEHLNAVAAGNGMFVAVGYNGTILSSPDGIEWTRRNSGTLHGLYSVIWGDGMFVAGGDSGTIITSGDGVEWTVRNSGWKHPIATIVWGGGKYLAYVVGRIEALTSSNGVEWVEFSVTCDSDAFCSPEYNLDFSAVTYGNGVFLVRYQSGYSSVYMSSDGIHWQESMLFAVCVDGIVFPTALSPIVYGNGIFLVGGSCNFMARSENGNDWEYLSGSSAPMRPQPNFAYIMYDGERFVVANRNIGYWFGGILFTENGSFLERVSAEPWQGGMSLVYNGDIYVSINRTEIITLSQGTTSVINHKQTNKRTSSFIVRQNGRILKITMPNQNTSSQVALFNFAGKRQKIEQASSGDGSISISLSNLATGSYILRVNDGKNSWQRRIILK